MTHLLILYFLYLYILLEVGHIDIEITEEVHGYYFLYYIIYIYYLMYDPAQYKRYNNK